jgi:putative N6-adenine-specific DNA methylase
VWSQVHEELQSSVRTKVAAPIVGSDRDSGAIDAARANAARAGVAQDLEFVQRAVSLAAPPTGASGLLVANPPYGERMGEEAALRDLYGAFGKLSRGPFAGWKVALLAANPNLVRHTGLGLRPVLNSSNGGIKIALYRDPSHLGD